MIAADCSNWQRVPTDADIAALKALGVTRVIIGTSFGTGADAQIIACAPHFDIQEYQFPEKLVPSAFDWWLDVEDSDYHTPTQAEVRAAMIVTPRPIGIYTSKHEWDALWPSWDIVAEFPWLKLWTANYGPLPRPFTPYGGWTKADMTQYHDTMQVNQDVDGTWFEVDLSEYEEEDMAAIQLIWNPDFGRLYVLGQGDPRWVVEPNAATELQRAYGQPTVALSWAALQALGAK